MKLGVGLYRYMLKDEEIYICKTVRMLGCNYPSGKLLRWRK